MVRWAFLLAWVACPVAADWALLNLIRHGERYADKSITFLAPAGKDRAQYIARCASGQAPTLAFPRGPPSALLAGRRQQLVGHNSTRPAETLQPLARKSGIRLDNDVHFKDVLGFVSYLRNLSSGSTVLVAWEHKMIGQLARAIDPQGLAPEKYPDHCKSEWTEPEYTEGACYDVIWQFVLHRAHASESWEAKGFSHLHMGFGGRDSSCTEAFQPFSNPSSWLGSSETSSTRLIDNTDSTTGAWLMLVSFGSVLFLAVGRLGLLHQSLRPGSERGLGKTGTEPLLDTPAENYVTVF